MAAVLEVVGAGPGAMAMAMAMATSSSSSSGIRSPVVRGAATMNNGSSSSLFYRAGLPACRGLKVVSGGRRFHGASSVRTTQPQKGSNAIVCEKSDTIGATGQVTDQTFQKLVLDSDVPVLVDFWAPWCGPCRMIAPVIDELAKQYAGKLKCLKLNTDDSPYIATEYGIRSIPTVMIFKRGEKKDTVIGAVPKSTLTTTIDKYVDW